MTIRIGHRRIGEGHHVFIIAEAGVNHNGRLDLARKLIEAAARAGADAVKFQTFQADRLNSRQSPKAPYQKRGGNDRQTQSDMLQKLELNERQHVLLQRHARRHGLIFLSTPFDLSSLDLLCRLKVPALKISSGDLTNLPFLKKAARRGKPIILSTGMGTLREVQDAVKVLRAAGNSKLILLHCISCYPTPERLLNLRTIPFLIQRTQCPVGFSDHSLGIGAAAAAVALGACVVEKHITLDRRFPGPDHRSSLEPSEFSLLVRTLREAHASLGRARKVCLPQERPIARVACKSIVSAVPIAKGTRLTARLLDIKRPGTGISPAHFDKVLGKRIRRTVAADTPLRWSML